MAIFIRLHFYSSIFGRSPLKRCHGSRGCCGLARSLWRRRGITNGGTPARPLVERRSHSLFRLCDR
eukprot:1086663-Prymnesium_polylepis.1